MAKQIIIMISIIVTVFVGCFGYSQYRGFNWYTNTYCVNSVHKKCQTLSIEDWNTAKKKALGISLKKNDIHIFTESSNNYWTFEVATDGILSISLLSNDQEPSYGMIIVLLNEDQSIVHKCNCYLKAGEHSVINWSIGDPGKYYLALSFVDNSPLLQSVYMIFSFSGEEQFIPLG